MKHTLLFLLATGLLFAAGCRTPGASSSRADAPTLTGRVIDFQPAIVAAPSASAGDRERVLASERRLTGSEMGGLLAAMGGGSLGQTAAREVESLNNRQEGYRIFIELENGEVIIIEQAAGIYSPAIGDPVMVKDGRARFHPLYR